MKSLQKIEWKEEERVLRLKKMLAGGKYELYQTEKCREFTLQTYKRQKEEKACQGKILKTEKILAEKEYEIFIWKRGIIQIQEELKSVKTIGGCLAEIKKILRVYFAASKN